MKVKVFVFFVLASVLLATGVLWRSKFVPMEPSAIITEIEHNIGRELVSLDEEAKVVEQSVLKNQEWPSVQHAFYLYDSTGIIQWNTNHYLPEPFINTFDTVVYIRNRSSHFLYKQFLLANGKQLIGYVPLQVGFSIQNQYLTSNLNKNIFSVPGISFNLSGNVYPVAFRGKNIFVISINSVLAVQRSFAVWSWIIFVFGIFFLFYASWIVVRGLLKNSLNWPAAVFIFFVLLIVRVLMVYGQFPGSSTEWTIFNPTQFASSSFNDSIGNFMFNTIALVSASICFFYFLGKNKYVELGKKPLVYRVAMASCFLIFCFAAQILPFLYLETIYHNSSITPDISRQLYYDPVRLSALICIVLSNLAGFFLLITFFRLTVRVVQTNWSVFLWALIVAVVATFLYHFVTERDYEMPIALTSLNLLILFFSLIYRKFKYISSRPFSLILLALIIFSLQAALTIRMLSIERQRGEMLKFGNSFLMERDVLGEYLLEEVIMKIESDGFIQQQILNPFNRLNAIEQKIKHHHLNSYFDRYDTRIYLFDNRGKSVGNVQPPDLPSLINEFIPLAKSTDYRGIYFINNPMTAPVHMTGAWQLQPGQYLKRYLVIVPIKYHVTGYVVLDLALRQVLPVTVFPKLLLDSRFGDYAKSSNYNFAVFHKGKMINSTGNTIYQSDQMSESLAYPELYRKGIDNDGFFQVAVAGLKGQTAIVFTPSYSGFYLMANFAFYFIIGLVLVLSAYLIINSRTIRIVLLTYSERIQLYVYLAIMLPMLVIAITIFRMNSRNETQRLEDESATKANHLANSMAILMDGQAPNLQQELELQAQATGVDVTIFSKQGTLLASSQPDIFSNQLVSKFIQPEALRKITKGNLLFALDDEISQLKFRNTFATVRSPSTGEVKAILSLPFFESQESTEKIQIRLVSNILIVFVFVLIGFYLLSFFALNWLTSPLKAIASTLKRTTFSGTNRKLVWKTKDEIGAMVNEYNRMIDNLEMSRAELEKRQREVAWREMARQVAHEIKNPLTPIKLTLQQMEKTFKEGKTDTDKHIRYVKSVLHQVEILNDIASSFSAFAQMPELKLEKIDIMELLKEAVLLFDDSSRETVRLEQNVMPAMVMADKKLFSRIFSNVILNALQSGVGNNKIYVNVRVIADEGNWLIIFSDNGSGIEPGVIDKIFVPYFSTKGTGSGLGLAIAKQGIEQAGGKIWCESSIGVGTTFYISLPSLI